MGLGSIVKGITKAVSSVTGGGGILGSTITGGDLLGFGGGILGNSMANDASSAAAAKANEFTENMMKNRHQWEVDDLKKAGLNPILSAGGTPSMGSSAKADVFNPVDDVAKSSSTAYASKRLNADLKAIEADIDNKKSSTDLNKAAALTQIADTNLKNNSARVAKLNGDMIGLDLPLTAISNANAARQQGNWFSKYVRPYSKTAADSLGDWTGAIGNIFHGSASSSTSNSTHYKGQ